MQSNRFRDRKKLGQTEGTEDKGETVTGVITENVTTDPIVDEVSGIEIGQSPVITPEELDEILVEKPKPPEASIGIKLTNWDNVSVELNDPTNGAIVNIKNWKIANKVVIKKILQFKKASYHKGVK